MTTLRRFSLGGLGIEASTAWYLSDLGELQGKQALYTQQSPQRLKALRESALIESALSSNRIEGVTIDPKRVRVMKSAYRDFIERVGEVKAPRGEKRQMVIDGINRLLSGTRGGFRISELEQICPGVSRDMVRHVLREQQEQGLVSCSGRGAGASWSRARDGNQGNK